MVKRPFASTVVIGLMTIPLLAGCQQSSNAPGEAGTQAGGAAGALAAASIPANHRALDALVGDALGAGRGPLIAAQKQKLNAKSREDAIHSAKAAERSPARASDVEKARTADLNNDGFITLDEVLAMNDAHLGDQEMISRLESTGQIFELTDQQESYLRDRGVSPAVLKAMRSMNEAKTLNGRQASTG